MYDDIKFLFISFQTKKTNKTPILQEISKSKREKDFLLRLIERAWIFELNQNKFQRFPPSVALLFN